MTDKEKQEIIIKAVKKAIDGGFIGYWAFRYKKCEELDEMEFFISGNIYEEGHSPEDLIFNHDFAKALWGEELTKDQKYGTVMEPKPVEYYTVSPAWKKHLMHMVISDDPIKYLGENL